MHPLTRILRSALLGTCHLRVIPPTVPDSGDTSGVYARAQGLIQRLRSIPQLRPVCDVGVLDLQSDVGKWIRYENHNLRTDLKGAHDKIALLQKYLHARGDHEMKTWDLWKELQGSESTAQELRDEICELKEALGSTRNAAAASAASLEIAKARAHAEAARSTTARREAASAAARADAMEVAVERMAQQLANVASGSTAHVSTSTSFAYIEILTCLPPQVLGTSWSNSMMIAVHACTARTDTFTREHNRQWLAYVRGEISSNISKLHMAFCVGSGRATRDQENQCLPTAHTFTQWWATCTQRAAKRMFVSNAACR